MPEIMSANGFKSKFDTEHTFCFQEHSNFGLLISFIEFGNVARIHTLIPGKLGGSCDDNVFEFVGPDLSNEIKTSLILVDILKDGFANSGEVGQWIQGFTVE